LCQYSYTGLKPFPSQSIEGRTTKDIISSGKQTSLPEFWVETGNAYRAGAGFADERASIAGLSVSTLTPSRADT